MLIKEYIKTLYKDNFVLEINEIITNVNMLLNLELEQDEIDNFSNKFIYLALDELVLNKDIITNDIQRRGYIIERGDYYIFQPIEIKDENIPMKYRYLGNKILPKSFPIGSFKNMEKAVKKSQTEARKKTVKIIPKSIDIDKILLDLNTKFNSIYRRIASKKEYGVYQGLHVRYNKLPDIKQIAMYFLHDYIETNEEINIKDLLLAIIKKYKDSTSDSLFNSEDDALRSIFEYYYVPSWKNTDKLTHVIDEGHTDPSKRNKNAKIIGINWYSESFEQRIFLVNDEGEPYIVPQTQLARYKDLKIKENTNNLSGIYGYQEKKSKDYKFHLINKLDGKYNIEMESSKKTQRRGAVCGTAKGAKNKPELIDLINKIIESMGIKDVRRYIDKKSAPKKTAKRNSSRNLCQEIEILLRHRDSSVFYEDFDSDGIKYDKISHNYRYFYRLLEKSAIDNTEK